MTATLSTSAPAPLGTRHPGGELRCACCFAERPEEVAAARDATRGFFDQVHPGNSADVEAAALVVSELVTNAIRHGHGPGTLTLTAHPDGLDITVTDPNPELPHARRPDTENGTGGLGWYLITAVCDQLDAAPNPGGGKTVHAHLPWAEEPCRVGASA